MSVEQCIAANRQCDIGFSMARPTMPTAVSLPPAIATLFGYNLNRKKRSENLSAKDIYRTVPAIIIARRNRAQRKRGRWDMTSG